MSHLKDSVVNSVFWLGGATAFSQAVTWVFTILVARLLAPGDYGLVAMAGVFIGITEYLNEFGIGAAIVQKKDLDSIEIKALYTLSILFGLFFVGVSFLAAHAMAYFFGEARLVAVIYALSATFIISSLKHVQCNLMVRKMKFKQIARIEMSARITTSMATYLCAVAGLGYWALVAGYLLYNMAQTVLYMAHERQRPGMVRHLRQAVPALRFGMQVMFARIIGSLSVQSDSFLVGKLVGTYQLGVYSFARSLANKPLEKIVSIFNQVLFPVLSREQGDKETLRRYYLKALEIELFIMLPIFIMIAITADSLVPVILGEKWMGIIFPLRLFAIIGIFQYLSSVSSMLVIAIGRPRMQVYYNTAVFIIMTAAMIVLGIPYGFNGILFAWAIFFPVISLVFFWIAASAIGISFGSLLARFRTPVLLVFIMILAMMVYGRFFVLSGWPQPVALASVGALTYIISMMVFDSSKFFEIIGTIRSKKIQKAS